MKKINWGILGTATIAVEKVIPAMQKGKYTHVTAIASRNFKKAQQVAKQFDITKAWGSYEDLIKDNEISAVYIPLPNNLHVEWATKALQAGKHVLCEKPIGLNTSEAERLLQVSQEFPQLKIMEAFMYRFHPQWTRVKEIIDSNRIGELQLINSHFSFFDDDPQSIVNKRELGGGSLLDIGCYSISLSRYLFDSEPKKILGHMDIDARFKIDQKTSGIMDFGYGKISTFTCATQQFEHQKVNIFGTSGMIEMTSPFIVEPDQSATLQINSENGSEKILINPTDHYAEQAEIFSQSILFDHQLPVSLDDAIKNMNTLDSIVLSSSKGAWITI